MTEARQLTQEEVQDQFMRKLASYVHYWATQVGDKSVEERLNGMAFSFLNILDGTTGLPGFELVPTPHEDDKQYHQDKGTNWWPENPLPGGAVTVGGSDMLHEIWYPKYAPFQKR